MAQKTKTTHKIKIKKGDLVKVIAGNSKGVQGKVLQVLVDANRAIVEGANKVKKHTKPSAANPQGGIIEKEAFLHISNVAIYNAATQKADRISYQLNDEGKKQRVYRSSGEVVATA